MRCVQGTERSGQVEWSEKGEREGARLRRVFKVLVRSVGFVQTTVGRY